MGGKKHGGKRICLDDAEALYEHIYNLLEERVDWIALAGSARRQKPEVGDLDIVLVPRSERTKEVATELFGSPTGGLYDGIQVDLVYVSPGSEGTALMHSTGSSMENMRLRRKAKRLGLKLNQYGLWQDNLNLAHGLSEEQIYNALGEPYVRPEDR